MLKKRMAFLFIRITAIFIIALVNIHFNSARAASSDFSSTNIEIRPVNNLSFYFQDIDIRTLLQLIARSSGLNFIISDAVKGNITLKLKNVTWQEALDIVLHSRGLASRQVGNVMFISTLEELTSTQTKFMQSKQDIENLSPLTSRLVRLKYTNAADMALLLKGPQSQLLTGRGQVAVDSRTNSIIIRDTRDNIADILPEIRRLDVPAKQVLIEARIVNVDTTFEEELGVKFGVTRPTHLTGTLEGANSMQQGKSPANVTNLAGLKDYTKRLNFNNAAAQLFDGANPGSVGLALARIGNVLLDLELSAMEGEHHGQVIARPRVVTSNQQKAIIQTGEEIPYQEATSSGATSVVFKNAVLSLEITPQITLDNRIVLQLKATEDTRGQNINVGSTTGTTPTTIPAINTQEVQSNVLLNDNETIVIGGVYKQIKDNTVDRVPFLGSLPVVGYLFRHTHEQDEKHELLIFITPKIINSSLNSPLSKRELYKGELYKGES